MTIFTLWYGTKSSVGNNDYETFEFEGDEIDAVTFAEDDAVIEYRAFETENGSIIVYIVVQQGGEVNADIDVYDSIEEAAKEYRFLLRNTALI